jgi:hypothetical protein
MCGDRHIQEIDAPCCIRTPKLDVTRADLRRAGANGWRGRNWARFGRSRAVMAKKRRGRPSTGHGKPITMRFREALLRAIDKHAAEEGITRSEWLRKVAEKAAKKRE